jgi:RNA polymerase sigma-70 factor (ECF subfamily)
MRSPRTTELDTQLPDDQCGPELQAAATDQRSRLIAAVRGLPLTFRETAALTLEGLTPNEIAETLGISANAVAIRLSRAKELLRQSLGENL